MSYTILKLSGIVREGEISGGTCQGNIVQALQGGMSGYQESDSSNELALCTIAVQCTVAGYDSSIVQRCIVA